MTLAAVIARIPRNFAGVSQVDILVVDDGSTDDSAKVASQSGAYVISHRQNQGVGKSFQTALSYALAKKYDIMSNIDADGQFEPEEIAHLLAPILDGRAEFVSGSRFLGSGKIEHMSAIKRWGNSQMTGLINRLTGKQFTDVSCGFRAYSREAMLRLVLHGKFTYTQETFLNLAFLGLSIVEVPIQVKYFADRKSRVAGSILRYTINTSMIIFRTYRDFRPLRFFSGIAAFFLLTGTGFLGFLGIWWLTNSHFAPHIWSGFVGAALVFTSLIFFVLGLVADMFVRLQRNQEELLYLVKRDGFV